LFRRVSERGGGCQAPFSLIRRRRAFTLRCPPHKALQVGLIEKKEGASHALPVSIPVTGEGMCPGLVGQTTVGAALPRDLHELLRLSQRITLAPFRHTWSPRYYHLPPLSLPSPKVQPRGATLRYEPDATAFTEGLMRVSCDRTEHFDPNPPFPHRGAP